MIPRLRFAHLPTPVEPLPRLSAALGGLRLLIKRDDQTGLAFGGNKTRKLELLLAEAQATGAHTLITAGAVQSNHCRQTAAAAAKFGFQCILVLTGDPPERLSGNVLLDRLFGAEVVYTTRDQRDAVLKETFDEAWAAGRRPYLIPYGGSNPIGALAYTFAFEELQSQAQDIDWIVFPSSSGGTQAGLVLGARRARWGGRVLCVSVDERAPILQPRIASLASEAADRLGEKLSFDPQDVLVNDEFIGEGYGVMGQVEREAIQLFARQEGILLDPVYTGRAAGGLIALAKRGFFKPGATVLFWHTGGTPALFADQYSAELLQGL